MKTRPENETVDRSRLKLLGVLAATTASGGCGQTGSTRSTSKNQKGSSYLITPSTPNSQGPDDPLVDLKKRLSRSKPIVTRIDDKDALGGEGESGGSGH